MEKRFCDLPLALQQRLGELTRYGAKLPPQVRVIPQTSLAARATVALCGLLFIGGGFALAAIHDWWREGNYILAALAILVGVTMTLAGAASVRALSTSPVCPAVIFTRVLAVVTGTPRGRVRLHYLSHLREATATRWDVGLTGAEHATNGCTGVLVGLLFDTLLAFFLGRRSTVRLTFDDGDMSFACDTDVADQTIAFLGNTDRILKHWEGEGTAAERISDLDWISDAQQGEPGRKHPRLARTLAIGCVSLLTAALLTAAAYQLCSVPMWHIDEFVPFP